MKFNSKIPEIKGAYNTLSIKSVAEITVKGFVKSSTNEPMVGVYIQVKDGSLVTSTDINGEYSINLPTGNEILVFSYLGYKTVEIPVEQKTFIPVIMEETDVRLGEVSIVSTGFQTISKERVTGSSGSVKSESLKNRPTTDLKSALNGQISGLVSDPLLGFIIRGRSTLSNSTVDRLPLVVVDGFPIEGGFETINPNDVKSVDVLKDAAATSIYGARAANGVIIITTKRATEKDKLRVNYNTFFSLGDNMDIRYYMNIVDSKTQIEYDDYFYNTFKGTTTINSPFNTQTFSGGTSDYYRMLFEKEKGLLSEQDFNTMRAKMLTLDYKDEFDKYILQKPFTQQHNIMLTGASEKNSYKLSVLYDGNKSHIQRNTSEKILLNLGNSYKISDRLTYNINANLTFQNTANNGATLGYAKTNYSPYTRIFDDKGNYVYQSDRYFLPRALAEEPRLPFSIRYNLLEESKLRDHKANSLDFRIQNDLEINVGKGLKIKPMFQYEQYKADDRNIYSPNSYAVRDLQNYTSVFDTLNKKWIAQFPPGGVYKYNSGGQRYSVKGRLQADYNNVFAGRHEVALLLGGEIINGKNQVNAQDLKYGYSSENLNYALYDFTAARTTIFNAALANSPALYEGGVSPISPVVLNRQAFVFNERYIAAFFSGSYTLDRKYTLSASLRTDASNYISRTNRERFSPFFSAGLRWNVLQEGFMKNNKTFDRLALRLTYGATGNAAGKVSVLPFSIFATTAPSGETSNLPAGLINGRLNEELTWEKTYSTNVGVDFSISNSKLFGSIDMYSKLSKDLITNVQTSNVIWSSTSLVINAAEVINKGIELTLGTNLNITDGLSWTGSINADYNYNKILKYDFTNAQLLNYVGGPVFVEGLPTDRILGVKLAGITKEGFFIQETKTGELVTLNNSSNSFAGFTALGSPIPGVKIKDDDRIFYGGRSTPPATLGFTNSFRWKGFTLMSVMTGRFGHKVKGFERSILNTINAKNYPQTAWDKIVKPSSLIASTQTGFIYPTLDNRLMVATGNDLYNFNSINAIDNASALRWDELYLGYDFGKNELGKIRNVFKNLTIYTQLRNLGLLWTNNKSGYDPGFLPGTVRPIRTLTFGARVGF
jgi:TonB-linked SusC/RagA family outer membrane protein